MALQPGHGEGHDPFSNQRSDEVKEFEHAQSTGSLCAESDMSVEPPWVLVSIVVGLIALAGSVLVIVVVCIAALVVWLARSPHPEGGQHGMGPFDGPTGGLRVWP